MVDRPSQNLICSLGERLVMSVCWSRYCRLKSQPATWVVLSSHLGARWVDVKERNLWLLVVFEILNCGLHVKYDFSSDAIYVVKLFWMLLTSVYHAASYLIVLNHFVFCSTMSRLNDILGWSRSYGNSCTYDGAARSECVCWSSLPLPAVRLPLRTRPRHTHEAQVCCRSVKWWQIEY